jgi:hypothetical protein
MARIPSLLRYALEAQAKGFHIFPVEPGDKLPARLYQERDPKDAPWRLKWGDAATNDVNKIVEWWTYAPMCNIGIACKPSGLFVVDCDRPKENDLLKGTPWERPGDGPRVDGEVAFFRVAERYGREDAWQAFDTYQVATGSGGRHFYYRWPTAVQSSQESPVKGLLDVRGNGGEKGGYVLGAGSITPKRSRPPLIGWWPCASTGSPTAPRNPPSGSPGCSPCTGCWRPYGTPPMET